MKTEVSIESTKPAAVVGTPLPFWTRFSSRKFWAMVACVIILWTCLERGANLIFSYWNTQQVIVYGCMYVATIGIIGAVVCYYMGIPTTYAASVSASASIGAQGQSISQTIDSRSEDNQTITSTHTELDETARNENLRGDRPE